MAIREYNTERGIVVYVDGNFRHLNEVPLMMDRWKQQDLLDAARYVEAVHADGSAYVLKDIRGESGPRPIPRSTESSIQ